MGILSWFSKSKTVTETKSHDGTYTIDMLVNSQIINESKAMKIEAYYNCVRDKAESIGQLPLKMFKSENGGRRVVLQGRNHRIFTQQPCDYLDMQGFLEMVVATIERRGAFYAYVERNDMGNVMSVIPFYNQNNIVPSMDVNGNVYYTYTTNDGKIKDPYRIEDLFIIKNFTLDGFTPVNPIVQCATLLGIASAQDDSYKELQENGITAQMALATDGEFKGDNAIKRLKEDWAKFRGPTGRKEIPILEQGLKPVSLKLTPQESELLGNREFTVDRVCRMVRVPVHRVGVSTGKSGSIDIRDLDEAYMRDSLNPILKKVEYALNKITPDSHMVEFNRKAFFAGSPWRLVEAVEREVKGGLASINEGRVDLGRETIEGGDIFAIDNNNVTYGQWTEVKEIQEQIYGQANNQQPEKPDNEQE